MDESVSLRAGAVFGETVGAAYVLGAAGAGVVLAIAAVANAAVVAIPLYAPFALGLGGVVGLLIGFVVGPLLGLLVRLGEARLGPAKVARLMPLVALSITAPLAFLFGHLGGTLWMLAIMVLDVTFTFAGARLIAQRYLKRAERAHLH
jgi:hypothetical protein